MIRCGHCDLSHHTVAQVRVCGTGVYVDPETGIVREGCAPCTWLIDTLQYDEDGQKIIRDCGHPAWSDERGWRCAAGHEHVYGEVRATEGWDYADDDEAAALAANGVVPVQMDGKPFIFV